MGNVPVIFLVILNENLTVENKMFIYWIEIITRNEKNISIRKESLKPYICIKKQLF